MHKDSRAIVHGRQIHVLYRKTSHRIYNLYRILLTVSSAERGPAKSSPSSCKVAQFSSHFLEGETSSLHWLKLFFSARFGIWLKICRWHETPLVSMLLLASGMVKMPTFLTPYNQNSPWGRTLKMTCFIARPLIRMAPNTLIMIFLTFPTLRVKAVPALSTTSSRKSQSSADKLVALMGLNECSRSYC